MAVIECNEINQNINYLLAAFANCKHYTNADMQLLVQLIAAVRECNDGGPNYNTLIQEVHEPLTDEVVTYPVDTYHSISVMVILGNITQVIDGVTVTYPTGTVLNHEMSNLNQTPYTFTVKAGSRVVVEYLIETV